MAVILRAAKSSVNTFVQVNSYKWAFYELCATIFVSALHWTQVGGRWVVPPKWVGRWSVGGAKTYGPYQTRKSDMTP